MKWFIKCLKHYADFSGRARRKEYWMFVLFYLIFAIVWALLATLVFTAGNSHVDRYEIIRIASAALICYSAVLTLPGIAVGVRRIRDMGMSGWLILVVLIPNIAGIWMRHNMAGSGWILFVGILQFIIGLAMFILMASEGNVGKNKYGDDPKKSPSTFGEKTMLKNVGVALIIGTAVTILPRSYSAISIHLNPPAFFIEYSIPHTITLNFCIYIATLVTFLIAGIFLLKIKSADELFSKGKTALVLLLTAASICLIRNSYFIVSNVIIMLKATDLTWTTSFTIWYIRMSVDFLFWLSLALFSASILFSQQYQKHIRKAAIAIVVLASCCLLISIYNSVGNAWYVDLRSLSDAYGNIMYVAYIMLASIFLMKFTSPQSAELCHK